MRGGSAITVCRGLGNACLELFCRRRRLPPAEHHDDLRETRRISDLKHLKGPVFHVRYRAYLHRLLIPHNTWHAYSEKRKFTLQSRVSRRILPHLSRRSDEVGLHTPRSRRSRAWPDPRHCAECLKTPLLIPATRLLLTTGSSCGIS